MPGALRHALSRSPTSNSPKSGVPNLNIAVREWNDQIIFLRKILNGRRRHKLRHPGRPPRRPARHRSSHRAKEILNNLETAELNAEGKPADRQEPEEEKAAIRAGLGQLDLL